MKSSRTVSGRTAKLLNLANFKILKHLSVDHSFNIRMYFVNFVKK